MIDLGDRGRDAVPRRHRPLPGRRTGWPAYELVARYVATAPGLGLGQGRRGAAAGRAAQGAGRRGAARRVPAERVLRGAAQEARPTSSRRPAGSPRLSTADAECPAAVAGRVVVVAGGGRRVPAPPLVARLAAAGATVVAADASAERLDAGWWPQGNAAAAGSAHRHARSSTCSTSRPPRTGPTRCCRVRPGRRPGAPGRRLARRQAASPRPTSPTGTLLQDLLVRTCSTPRSPSTTRCSASDDGRFVLVSAAAGAARRPASNASYAAAKAAAEAWTLALADSFRRHATAAAVDPGRQGAAHAGDARRPSPTAKFSGYTDVADLADAIVEPVGRPGRRS